jgi:hypothetical protein
LWWKGRPSPTPGNVIKETLEIANAGDYEKAARNMAYNLQEIWEENPGLRDAMLDSVTRGRTITEVEILASPKGSVDRVTVVYGIRYRDGSDEIIRDSCHLRNGEWKWEFADTIKAIAPEFDVWNTKAARMVPIAVAASKLHLQDNFSNVPGCNVRIRLPGNCQWEMDKNHFVDTDLYVVVTTSENGAIGLEAALKLAKSGWETWKAMEVTGIEERDVVVSGRNGKLLVGNGVLRNTPGSLQYRVLSLVIGTETQSVIIEGRTPRTQHMNKLLEESLLTAKWEP